MRLETERGLLGERLGQRIALSKAERATLTKASAIAERARNLARVVYSDYEQWDDDTLLAEIEHNARELSENGEIRL